MFKKLFGDKKKEQQPTKPVVPQEPSSQQKEIEFEKAMNNLNVQIAKIEQSSDVIETKLEKIDSDIRSLIAQKKKKQAKTKLMQAQGYKNQIDKFETQKNVLIGMKIKLETAQTNQTSVGVIGDVNKILKDQEKINEKMQEQMEDYQDIVQAQQEQDMMWNQLNDMQNQDMEDVDDELKRYEQEVEQEQANKVANDFNQIPSVNISTNQQKQQVQQQPMQNQQQSAFENQMYDLLN